MNLISAALLHYMHNFLPARAGPAGDERALETELLLERENRKHALRRDGVINADAQA